MDHDFVTICDRRWCLCCDLFQQKSITAAYFPTPRKPCPRNTPYAGTIDSEREQINAPGR